MNDDPTAVLDRDLLDDAPTMQLYSVYNHLLMWPIRDADPPLTEQDPRVHTPANRVADHYSTSIRTLERLLDGLRRL